jgi:nucleotidyltransferase/DNA polymerase involved in DNA repair
MGEHTANRKVRRLRDLHGIGPAMLRDFERLNIRTVAQLARAKPKSMYERLAELDGRAHDICCLDVFRCAVAQARNPRLPAAQRKWWSWSRKRKK